MLSRQGVEMRGSEWMAALGRQQLAHEPVGGNRIARRFDGNETDASIVIRGELAAKIHVRLAGVLALVQTHRGSMPDIDLDTGDWSAGRVLVA